LGVPGDVSAKFGVLSGGMKPEFILKIVILVAAFASFVLSVTLYFRADGDIAERLNGIYVGIWVPSILALGAVILSGNRGGSK
jgi:hypothetical protein